jgi:hypothetical protein
MSESDETPEWKAFVCAWNTKTTKQVTRELASMRRYVQKHSAAYSWHGKGITPPGALADGDKILALQEILASREGTAV